MKLVDMHCDTISRLLLAKREGKSLSLRENDLHLDLLKMRKGGYLLQNFAMFVHMEFEQDPLVAVLELIDEYYRQIEANSDLIAPVYCYDDMTKNAADGKLSALLTIEEGGVLRGSPAVLRMLYRLGVRMLTLTWNFENEIGYPNTTPNNEAVKGVNLGLKPAGIEIVREMENIGMIVDVSHLGDQSFWDVVKYTKRPFVASHSNARSLCGHTRNLTDEMIKALADRGGVTGINFCGAFLNPDGSSKIGDMISHMKHIINVGGIDCLGLGTDFDGIDGELEVRDAGCMPLLVQEMEQVFTGAQMDAILGGNVLRLYREVLK